MVLKWLLSRDASSAKLNARCASMRGWYLRWRSLSISSITFPKSQVTLVTREDRRRKRYAIFMGLVYNFRARSTRSLFRSYISSSNWSRTRKTVRRWSWRREEVKRKQERNCELSVVNVVLALFRFHLFWFRFVSFRRLALVEVLGEPPSSASIIAS